MRIKKYNVLKPVEDDNPPQFQQYTVDKALDRNNPKRWNRGMSGESRRVAYGDLGWKLNDAGILLGIIWDGEGRLTHWERPKRRGISLEDKE